MRSVKFWKSQVPRSQTLIVIGLAALGLSIGLYAIVVGGLDNRKLALVLFVTPVFFGLATLRHAPRLLFSLLVVSLSFSARFRPPGYEFHPGGAELALAPVDFPLFLLTVLCLAQILKRRQVIKLSVKSASWPFALFLAAHLLSIIPAANPGLAWLELLRLVKMGLLVLITSYYLDSRKKIEFVVRMLLLTVVLQGALAVIQSVFHTSLGLDFLGEHQYWIISKEAITIGRAGGTLGHANALANFFEVWTPIGLALLFLGAKAHFRPLVYSTVLLGIVGTFLTFSRAAWLSLLLGLSLVVFQHLKGSRRIRITPALVAMGLLVGLIGLFFGGTIITRFTVFWEGSRVLRVITAQTAFNMLRSNPIAGVGANNYLNVSNAYVDPHLSPGLGQRAATWLVHNVPLLYGAELGLVGVISFLLLLLWVLWLARQIIRHGDRFLASLSIGILGGMIALIAHGMWDWLFRYDPVYTLFWFNVGLLVATRNIILAESGHQEDTVG